MKWKTTYEGDLELMQLGHGKGYPAGYVAHDFVIGLQTYAVAGVDAYSYPGSQTGAQKAPSKWSHII